MKLIYCTECNDMVRLSENLEYCHCGESYGKNANTLESLYGGKAVPIGISDPSLVNAVHNFNSDLLVDTEEIQAMVFPKNHKRFKYFELKREEE